MSAAVIKVLELELKKIEEKIDIHAEWMERFRVVKLWDHYNKQRELWIFYHGRKRYINLQLNKARRKNEKPRT